MRAFHLTQYFRRLAWVFSLLVFLNIGVAHAQTPSYVGPWVYTTSSANGVIMAPGHATEAGSLDAAYQQMLQITGWCKLVLVQPWDSWARTIYNSGPVQGIETAESRFAAVAYHAFEGESCASSASDSAILTVVRERVVCSSAEVFKLGKCYAFDPYTYPGRGEGNLGPQCPSCGQPINPGTGNMWHVETDFAGTGAAKSLVLKRIYNSIPFGLDNRAQRLFGSSWTSQYDVVLRANATSDLNFMRIVCYKIRATGQVVCRDPNLDAVGGAVQAVPAGVTITRPDGNEYTFNKDGELWRGNIGNNDRIEAIFNAEGTAVVAWDYTVASNGATERFDAQGRLLSITEMNGSRQLLTYSDGINSDTSSGRYPADAPACGQLQTESVARTNRPLCVTDHWGRKLEFKYDALGRVVKMFDPANGEYAYEYDGPTGGCDPANPTSAACNASNLTKVTYPGERSHTYVYNEAGRINGGATCAGNAAPAGGRAHLPHAMTGLIDEKENRFISWEYNCDGRALSSQLAGGVEKVTLAYQVSSSQTVTAAVTHYLGDPAAPTTSVRQYRAAPVRGVVKNIDINAPCVECGTVKVRAYDGNGNLATSIDFRGIYTTYGYDLVRNLETSRIEDDIAQYSTIKRKISTSWHPTLRLPAKIAEPKKITSFTYDGAGNMLTRTVQASSDPHGLAGFAGVAVGSPQVWTYTYNAVGQVLTIDGARTDVADITQFSYDAFGNLLTVTSPLGHVTTYSEYDGAGRAGRIVAPGGMITSLQYNPRGLLRTATTTAGGVSATTTYEYNEVGRIEKVTMPDNSTLTYGYDDAQRLTSIVDNLGNRVGFTLDLTGNRTAETITDSSGVMTRKIARVYNSLNQVQQVTGAAQ